METISARHIDTPHTSQPVTAILGSVPLTCLITNAGGGETRYGNIVVNRWRDDPTCDDHGQFCYVRDVTNGRVWSAAYQPACVEPESYGFSFDDDCAVFERRDGEVETRMEIRVLPENAAEARTIRITNASSEPREIELTSYSEIVIAPPHADRHHPAFQNLFVQTEWIENRNAILAMRRPRSAASKPVWCGHMVVTRDSVEAISCETDRARFIGRGRSVQNPAAMAKEGELSGRVGAVLDPVFAIRVRITVPAYASVDATFLTFVSTDRDSALAMLDRCQDPLVLANELDRAGSVAQPEHDSPDVAQGDAAVYQQIASELHGDSPLVVASVQLLDGLNDARRLIRAQRYLERKGITPKLVVLAHGEALSSELKSEITDDDSEHVEIVRSDTLGTEELSALEQRARIRIECDGSGLASFVETRRRKVEAPARRKTSDRSPQITVTDEGLRFFNGIGGFNDSDEYEIRIEGSTLPPAPWVNVIANPNAGCIVSETGAGATWVASGSSFRLSPWNNDPVSDPLGECIYLRDEETGELWSATPAPIRDASRYTIRHGTGYSTFDHEHDGVSTSLKVGVPLDDPVKLQVLTLRNNTDRRRRISISAYAEWVLGAVREKTRHEVSASFDRANSAILAANPHDPDLPHTTAFLVISEPAAWYTTSRAEFIGRNGNLAAPAALVANRWAKREEKTSDPCGMVGTIIEIGPGETRSISVALGAGATRDAALGLALKYRHVTAADNAIDAAVRAWNERLSTIAIKTPDPSFDLMINRWSLYQALSCRIWGRNALYQSSGAMGFRDQLQDVMAFPYAEPEITREQIVRAASRQFIEGDVQHWWHPHSGRGLRTRFADDLVWLPFVVDHYLRVTGDRSVLDEQVPYLEGRLLDSGEDELFMLPTESELSATVFDHCIHILHRATTTGSHGLPLIGSGDWNDGMNRVGAEGRGESVWLAWFIASTLRSFSEHAEARGYRESAQSFRKKADAYIEAVERTSWDGEWYRRAYYDDGAPIGSHVNTECRIDSIAQSWSVISKAGDPERSRIAMASLHQHLVRDDARLIMLLTPPFDKGTHDPGYIRGYLPGVRENGAQYTHAALWAVMATAMQGEGDRAFELFQMINPITHTSMPADVETYKVEPYVVAADVYTAEGHLGRGGWTWYTGSASWFYRVGLESVLGFSKRGDALVFNPCIPSSWKEFTLDYRFGESIYKVVVRNPHGVQEGVRSVVLDGSSIEGAIPLTDDRQTHAVEIILGPPQSVQ